MITHSFKDVHVAPSAVVWSFQVWS